MKKIILLMALFVLLSFLQSCKREQITNNQDFDSTVSESNENYSVHSYEEKDIPDVLQQITATSKQSLSTLTGKTGSGNFSIDTQNVIGMVDSLGNTTYALRMNVRSAPRNTLYNLIVGKRVDGTEMPPSVMEYVMDDDYFLDRIEGIKKKEGYHREITYYSFAAFAGTFASTAKTNYGPSPCGTLQYDQSNRPKASASGASGSGGSGGPKEGAPATGNFNSVGYVTISIPTVVVGGKGGRTGTVEGGKGCFCGWAPQAMKGSRPTLKSGDCLNGEFLVPINEHDEHVHLDDEANNPCVKKILGELQRKDLKNLYVVPDVGGLSGTGHLAQGILRLFDKMENLDLVFKVDEAGPGKNATTTVKSGRGNASILVVLDDDFVRNATQLAFARTVIHESVHAYLRYATSKYAASDTAILLAEYQKKYDASLNMSHHQYMAQFAEAMGKSLSVWDNNQQSSSYYTNLAWSWGMINSDAYKLLSQTQKNNIVAANIAEGSAVAGSSKNAKGIKCR